MPLAVKSVLLLRSLRKLVPLVLYAKCHGSRVANKNSLLFARVLTVPQEDWRRHRKGDYRMEGPPSYCAIDHPKPSSTSFRCSFCFLHGHSCPQRYVKVLLCRLQIVYDSSQSPHAIERRRKTSNILATFHLTRSFLLLVSFGTSLLPRISLGQ